MTLAEMRAETLVQLDDPNGERFCASRVNQAINDAALDLSIRSGCLRDNVSVAVAVGTDSVDLAAAATGLRLGYIERLAWNDRLAAGLRSVSMDEIDMAGYATAAGEPSYWYQLMSPGAVMIQSATRAGALIANYVAEPAPLIADSDDLPLADEICIGVCHGAAELILEDGENLGLAAFHGSMFEDAIREATWAGHLASYDDMRPL